MFALFFVFILSGHYVHFPPFLDKYFVITHTLNFQMANVRMDGFNVDKACIC